MIIGALGDVHANLSALRAAFEALDAEGIQVTVSTGDLVVGGDFPNEVLDLLREREVPSVQGEKDRQVARFMRNRHVLERHCAREEIEAIASAYERCTSENIEYLRRLPPSRRVRVDGTDVAVCHGTLNSVAEDLPQDASEEVFLRQRELTPARIVICGRTHRAFTRKVADTLFVNPGSVGMAHADGRIGTYAVVSTEEEPWSAEIRAVQIG